MFEDDDDRRYLVVSNHEEQYSIWPADHPLPVGWKPDGTAGTKAECLAHIEEVWTDMRPKSLRDWMRDQSRTLFGQAAGYGGVAHTS